jgi:hypothetical protein
MCSVRFSQQTIIVSLNSVNRLLAMDIQCLFCERAAEILDIKYRVIQGEYETLLSKKRVLEIWVQFGKFYKSGQFKSKLK